MELDYNFLEDYFAYEIVRLQKVVQGHKDRINASEEVIEVLARHDQLSSAKEQDLVKKIADANEKIEIVAPKIEKLQEQLKIVEELRYSD